MSALRYLFFTRIKNSFREMLRHPSRLIGVLLLAAVVVLLLVMPGGEVPAQEMRSRSELFAMAFALFGAVFIMISLNGLSSGASFYSMADVHLLFQTPISPRRILLYGMVRQLGTSLMLGVFLIFQYSWLHSLYGIEIYEILYLLVGYALAIFTAQILSMLLYSFTSGQEGRQRLVKRLTAGICVVLIAALLLPAVGKGDFFTAVSDSVNRAWVYGIPVAGWLMMAMAGCLGGNLMLGILGFGLTILAILVLLVILAKSRPDFYEDVLQATEVSFTAINAKKEGKMVEAIPKHVRVGKIGIKKGSGSGVFYYKHRLENRRARLFLLDTMSLIFALVVVVMAFFMREEGEVALLTVFGVATYMQLFSSATGRWIRELQLPYIYLLPEKPFHKLVMLCRENLVQIIVEALVIFIPVGFLLQASVSMAVMLIAARIGFGLLFMAGNIFIERMLGGISSKAILLSLYFLLMIAFVLPGIILGIFLWSAIPALSVYLFFTGTMVANLLLTAILLFASRNMLNYAELNNQ